jgi:hypothetical protein
VRFKAQYLPIAINKTKWRSSFWITIRLIYITIRYDTLPAAPALTALFSLPCCPTKIGAVSWVGILPSVSHNATPQLNTVQFYVVLLDIVNQLKSIYKFKLILQLRRLCIQFFFLCVQSPDYASGTGSWYQALVNLPLL